MKALNYILIFVFLNLFSLLLHAQSKFKGHSKKINAIEISPENQIMATASDDKSIRLWNLSNGKRIKTLKKHQNRILCLNFSNNGKLLLSGDANGEIILWNAETGERLKSYKESNYDVKSVRFSADNNYFASGYTNGEIRFWKIGKRKSIALLKNSDSEINDIKFSPVKNYFASASSDGEITLWNTNTLKKMRSLNEHTAAVNALEFSHDGKFLYSAGSDMQIIEWNTNRTQFNKKTHAHSYAINDLAISSDGKLLFSASDDGRIKSWQTSDFENIFSYTEPDFMEIKDIHISSNQKYLALANTTQTPGLILNPTEAFQVEEKKSNIWVLIIGISKYKYLPELKYATNDAMRMYGFYKSPQGGALPDEQIKILTNDAADKRNILLAAKQVFEKADTNDIVIFYFSGHGEVGVFQTYRSDEGSDDLSHEEIVELLTLSKAKFKLCIADACHSGSLYKNDENNSLITDNTVFFLSSSSEEKSLEYKNLQQGVFTYYLIEGLKGHANLNDDYVIDIEELSKYVNYQVGIYTNNNQTPLLKGNYNKTPHVGYIFLK